MLRAREIRYEVSAEIPLRLRESVLSEQFVDFAELFAEDCKVVPWYAVFAKEISERPLSQATPFFIVN
jgi:hypothetical protein